MEVRLERNKKFFSMSDANELKDLIPLKAPIPPLLAKVLGYKGNARYVSFNRTPLGDEVEFSDGRESGTGNWQAFLAYIQHPAVSPFHEGFDLGSSESEAKHVLILDRAQQQLYIAPVREAENFLHGRWPQLSPSRILQEEKIAKIAIALGHRKQSHDVDIEEIQQRIEEQHVLIETMLRWLDKQLKN
jgi:hypothetical protein